MLFLVNVWLLSSFNFFNEQIALGTDTSDKIKDGSVIALLYFAILRKYSYFTYILNCSHQYI